MRLPWRDYPEREYERAQECQCTGLNSLSFRHRLTRLHEVVSDRMGGPENVSFAMASGYVRRQRGVNQTIVLGCGTSE